MHISSYCNQLDVLFNSSLLFQNSTVVQCTQHFIAGVALNQQIIWDNRQSTGRRKIGIEFDGSNQRMFIITIFVNV